MLIQRDDNVLKKIKKERSKNDNLFQGKYSLLLDRRIELIIFHTKHHTVYK